MDSLLFCVTWQELATGQIVKSAWARQIAAHSYIYYYNSSASCLYLWIQGNGLWTVSIEKAREKEKPLNVLKFWSLDYCLTFSCKRLKDFKWHWWDRPVYYWVMLWSFLSFWSCFGHVAVYEMWLCFGVFWDILEDDRKLNVILLDFAWHTEADCAVSSS